MRGRETRVALVSGGAIAHLQGVDPSRAGVERAGSEADRAGSDDAPLQPPYLITAPLGAACELFTRRLFRREMQIQGFTEYPLGRPAHADGAHRLGFVDGVEHEPGVGRERLLESRALLPRRDHEHLHRRPLARKHAQCAEVLREPQHLGAHEYGERLRHHVHGAFQAREAQAAFLDEALPQPRPVDRDDEGAAAFRAQLARERRREQRHRVHAGQLGARLLQRIQPGRKLLRVRERGEEQALVAPRAGHGAERQRRGETGVAVALREPALQHGVAVAAAQERNLVLMEVLARDIDQHAEELALQAAQVLAERRDAEVVAGKLRLQLEPRRDAAVEVVVLGGEVENAPRGHG